MASIKSEPNGGVFGPGWSFKDVNGLLGLLFRALPVPLNRSRIISDWTQPMLADFDRIERESDGPPLKRLQMKSDIVFDRMRMLELQWGPYMGMSDFVSLRDVYDLILVGLQQELELLSMEPNCSDEDIIKFSSLMRRTIAASALLQQFAVLRSAKHNVRKSLGKDEDPDWLYAEDEDERRKRELWASWATWHLRGLLTTLSEFMDVNYLLVNEDLVRLQQADRSYLRDDETFQQLQSRIWALIKLVNGLLVEQALELLEELP